MKLSKNDWIILLGNSVDHFDTALYVFLAPVFASVFFPQEDPTIALIMAYGLLVTSIITKPLGSYIFSIIAKKHTPMIALSYSLIGVGIFTLLIGLLPSYENIGIFSPILLLVARILGEIFASGENAIAKLHILENKIGRREFKSSYLYQTSTIFGTVLASFAAMLVQYFSYIEYLWRLCFIVGGVSAIIGYIFRKNSISVTTKVEKKALKFYGLDSLSILWRNKINLFRIAIINSFSYLTYTIPFIVMNNLIPFITDISIIDMMVSNTAILIFDMLAIPLIGSIISRHNAKIIMLSSSLTLAITIIPLWYFISEFSIYYINFVRIWIVIFGVIFLCPLNIWCKNQATEDDQYLVVSMGTAIGGGLVGKLTPFISLSIYHFTGSFMMVGFYIATIFVLTAFIIFFDRSRCAKQS